MQFVAGQGPEAFVTVFHVRADDGLAILKHPGRAGEWLAAEVVDEIQHVRAEHPQIFAAAAPVAFAASADFENLAEMSVSNKLVDHREHGMPAIAMGDGDFGAVFFAGGSQ